MAPVEGFLALVQRITKRKLKDRSASQNHARLLVAR